MREKLKTILLVSLFGLSVLLTTKLWFTIPILDISSDDMYNKPISYDDYARLSTPNQIVINTGKENNRILLVKDKDTNIIFNSILTESRTVLRAYMLDYNIDTMSQYGLQKLIEIRDDKNIELIYRNPIEKKIFLYSIGIKKDVLPSIDYIDTVIINSSLQKIFFVDMTKNSILEYVIQDANENMEATIAKIDTMGKTYCVFMNESDDTLYGDKMVLPITDSNKTMSMRTATSEIAETDMEDITKMFFGKVVKHSEDNEGAKVYTDGQNASLRIDKTGAIDYIRYDVNSRQKPLSLIKSYALAVEFINNHLGYPMELTIEYVNPVGKKEISGYKFGFIHSIEASSIIRQDNFNNASIEVEIIGNKVRQYKRCIRNITTDGEPVAIISAIVAVENALNAMRLRNETTDIVITDVYTAYNEYSFDIDKVKLIPVWVVKVAQKESYRKIMINAVSGVVIQY